MHRKLIQIVCVCMLFLPKLVFAQVPVYKIDIADALLPAHASVMTISIDPAGKDINSFKSELIFSDTVRVLEIRTDNSPTTFWLEKEVAESGRQVSLAGSIPSPIQEPFIVAHIVFRATVPNSNAIIYSRSSTIYAHDGQGTIMPLTELYIDLPILSVDARVITSTQDDLLLRDDTVPQISYSNIVRDSNIFENKFVLYFLATDKESGIQFVEVREGNGPWMQTSSPYILAHQFLPLPIAIRATDMHGNTQIVYVSRAYTDFVYGGVFSLCFFVEVSALIMFYWKSKKSKN